MNLRNSSFKSWHFLSKIQKFLTKITSAQSAFEIQNLLKFCHSKECQNLKLYQNIQQTRKFKPQTAFQSLSVGLPFEIKSITSKPKKSDFRKVPSSDQFNQSRPIGSLSGIYLISHYFCKVHTFTFD